MRNKSCLLCCSEFITEDDSCQNCPKAYEVCEKYLHSALTGEYLHQQFEGNQLAYCTKCYNSAMKLFNLSEEIKSAQKRVTECALIFSLEILHRRTKTTHNEANETPGDLLLFDISAFQNCNTWDIPTPVSEKPSESKSPEETSESTYFEVYDPLFLPTLPVSENNPPDTFVNVKCENNCILNLIDESFEKGEEGNAELPTIKENVQDNIGKLRIEMNNSIPVLKLQRLEFHSNESEDVVIDTLDIKYDSNNQIDESLDSSCVNLRSRNDFITAEPGNAARHEKCYDEGTESLLQEIPVSTYVHCPSLKSASSLYLPENIQTNKIKEPDFVAKEKFQSQSFRKKKFKVHGDVEFTYKNRKSQKMSIHCNACNKRFSSKGSLKLHKMIHTGDLPFKCEVCSKSFISKYKLDRHAITHSNNRPFKCDICGKGFTQNCSLKRHRAIHGFAKALQCSLCPLYFAKSSSLKSHLQKMHH